jgi:hypothetical protein
MGNQLSKQELLEKLAQCAKGSDVELAHCEADLLLLTYINDDEIEAAYKKVEKWYR